MQPVWDAPALRFDQTIDGQVRRWLAVSELHIGFESGLARRGAFLRSRSGAMADRLLAIMDETAADRLLVLGDVKDRVASTSPQERRDVPAFFEALAGVEDVVITRGNHDAGLQALIPRKRFANVRITPAAGVVIPSEDGAVGALHGHAWPKPALMKADTILVGHTHAAARLVDEHGRATTEWAWARGRLDPARVLARYGVEHAPRLIVFPPFNPLLGGAAVNRDGLLGPLGKLVDYATLRLHLLDGRDLGAVGPPR
jgi:hypothetical protein